MVTSIVLITLLGTLQFNSAISAAINYEPIQITVNENFNAQPGQVSSELKGPGATTNQGHQGAIFLFKPQLSLPPSYIPSLIEAFISLIQQHHHSWAKDTSKVVVEKDKLIENLKPFMSPLSDISKKTLAETVLEKENILEIVNPIIITEDSKPVAPELLAIPKALVLPTFKGGISSVVEEEVKKEESVILEEPTGVFPTIPELAVRPITDPIINYNDPKPINAELVVITEASVLPPLFTNDMHIVEEEVKIEEPIVVDAEPEPAIQKLVAIPEALVLPSFSLHNISSIIEKEVKKEELIILEEPTGVFPKITDIAARPITKPNINYGEPKPAIQELVEIPQAPVLPSLSLHDISAIFEEVKKEESIILEEPTGVVPTIPEIAVRPITEPIINYIDPKPINAELVVIPEAPVLPPLFTNDMHVVEEEVKIEEPIVVDAEPEPAIQELVAIPEAPVLPSFSLHDISSINEEEVKKEELIMLEEPTGVFPKITDVAARPITEPNINYGEPKPAIQELVEILQAPVLSSLSLHDISAIFEEVKKEESIILEETTGVVPTIPEIAVRPIMEPIINYIDPKPINAERVVIPKAPVLSPLFTNDMHVVEEEVKIEEPIVVDAEPEPAIQELVAIPEAPVLPSFSLHDISSINEEEVKKEELILLEEPTGVFPKITDITARPFTEPNINYGEPKPTIQENVEIPEAPVVPSLSLHDISAFIKEVNKEESIILEEPTGVVPTIPEIAVRPITEPIINYIDPKPINAELVVIPEAPVLPPLFTNDMHVVEEEVKIEEPIVVDVEPEPAIQELVEIPEAPVLPSFSLHEISDIIEEVKKEESIILEEPTGVFPTISETAVRPITEPIINYIDPKPINAELLVIPEAPVLPPRFTNDMHVVEEEVKIEEPIVVDVEPEPAIQELVEISEAPVLPSLSLHDISDIIEEVKKEESIILEEPTGVFPTMPEIDVIPTTEPIINYGEPKPINAELLVIPEAPVLPPLILNGFHEGPVLPAVSANDSHVVEEKVEIEEPVIVDSEPKPVTSEVVAIPEAPVLPPLSYDSISPVVEKVKIEESIKVEESTGVFLSIPKISARPFPEPLENTKVSEIAESFALKNNIFPVTTEEVKIEIPKLLEESIEVFPPIAEMSSGSTLQQSSLEITDSYGFDEVSQPNSESAVTVMETLPPTIISKPSNHLGVFSYVPFISHLFNLAPKKKSLMNLKPVSLERFLTMKHPFRLPVTPFPKLNLKSSIWGNKKQFLNPTTYAHDVVEKRIAPNMAFKKQNAPKRVKNYIRSKVPKRPSYL